MMGVDVNNVTAPYATMMANMMSTPYMNQFMGMGMQGNWNPALAGKNMMWMNEQKVSKNTIHSGLFFSACSAVQIFNIMKPFILAFVEGLIFFIFFKIYLSTSAQRVITL